MLSGSGVVAISSPIGLKIALASIPSTESADFTRPPQFYDLGQLSVGNLDGWLDPVSLRRTAQLVYPLADGFTQLGYDLVGTTTATVDELVGVVTPSTLAPWDRNATPIAFTPLVVVLPGGTAALSQWTYTVPAGKKLYVQHLEVRLDRSAVASVNGTVSGNVRVDNVAVLLANSTSNIVGILDRWQLDGPLVLAAGQTLLWRTANSDTGGSASASIGIVAFTFDG